MHPSPGPWTLDPGMTHESAPAAAGLPPSPPFTHRPTCQQLLLLLLTSFCQCTGLPLSPPHAQYMQLLLLRASLDPSIHLPLPHPPAAAFAAGTLCPCRGLPPPTCSCSCCRYPSARAVASRTLTASASSMATSPGLLPSCPPLPACSIISLSWPRRRSVSDLASESSRSYLQADYS